MLSRRVLRIKVMQALYAFLQNNDDRLDLAEKKLEKSLFSIYDLYIHELSFLVEIFDFARASIEISRNKYLPTPAETDPNTRFVENRIIYLIENNPDYILKRDNLKINWAEQKDMIRRIHLRLKEDEKYLTYMNAVENGLDDDEKILEYIVDNYMAENDELQQYFEEINIYWAEDFYIACNMVIKTLKNIKQSDQKFEFLPKLFGNNSELNEKEDLNYTRDLFCKTLINLSKYDDMIEAKLDHWDLERIALMDSLIMKMALTEFIEFPSIPAKVTINEYIEISKMYSTPRSKIFINGVLDKMLFDLMEKKKIQKKGRGLID